MVPGLAKLSHEERLRRMNLLSLVYRKTRGDAIEVYKYLHGIYKVDCSELLQLHEPGNMKTLGHILKLKKRNCKLQRRKIVFWNSNCEHKEQFTCQSRDCSHCELLQRTIW